jgi:hypothetical protein
LPRIPLAFERGKLELVGQLTSPNLAKPAQVTFLVDTGSTATILSLRDAEMMGLAVGSLPRSTAKSGGYGGPIELRVLNHVILVFATSELKPKCVELPAIGVQYSPLKDLRDKRMIYGVPTVIGTDALAAGRFTLWADWKLKQGHLDFIE